MLDMPAHEREDMSSPPPLAANDTYYNHAFTCVACTMYIVALPIPILADGMQRATCNQIENVPKSCPACLHCQCSYCLVVDESLHFIKCHLLRGARGLPQQCCLGRVHPVALSAGRLFKAAGIFASVQHPEDSSLYCWNLHGFLLRSSAAQ
jgi:hypothetical protein